MAVRSGFLSDYLHRSGGPGRSRPRRWTRTARGASAGEAGRRSTPARWRTWSTAAGRLAPDKVGNRQVKLWLAQDTTPGSTPAQPNPEALFWATENMEITQPSFIQHVSCQALYEVLSLYGCISSSQQPYGVDIIHPDFTDEEQTHRGYA